MALRASLTQSTGVPLTENIRAVPRSGRRFMRNGLFTDSEDDWPDWGESGATTITSPKSAAQSTRVIRPLASIESSLVMSMSILCSFFTPEQGVISVGVVN